MKQANSAGTNTKENHQRLPGDNHTPTCYGHTIAKAIKKAFHPERLKNEQFELFCSAFGFCKLAILRPSAS